MNDRAFLRALKSADKEQRQVLRRLRRNTLSKKLFLADFNVRTAGLKRQLIGGLTVVGYDLLRPVLLRPSPTKARPT